MDTASKYEVSIRDVEAQTTAVVRTRSRQSELSSVVPAGCGAAWNYARAAGLPKPGHNIALYRDYVDGEMTVEAGAEMTAPIEGDGNVIASSLPAGRVATTTHIGPYDRMGDANAAIHAYCTEHGLAFEGTSWEIYGHMGPDSNEPPRTDVYYLLKP